MSESLQAGLKSPMTTLGGWLAFGAALFPQLQAQFDGDPATLAEWGLAVTALIFAISLTFARDANKTSEEAGAA